MLHDAKRSVASSRDGKVKTIAMPNTPKGYSDAPLAESADASKEGAVRRALEAMDMTLGRTYKMQSLREEAPRAQAMAAVSCSLAAIAIAIGRCKAGDGIAPKALALSGLIDTVPGDFLNIVNTIHPSADNLPLAPGALAVAPVGKEGYLDDGDVESLESSGEAQAEECALVGAEAKNTEPEQKEAEGLESKDASGEDTRSCEEDGVDIANTVCDTNVTPCKPDDKSGEAISTSVSGESAEVPNEDEKESSDVDCSATRL